MLVHRKVLLPVWHDGHMDCPEDEAVNVPVQCHCVGKSRTGGANAPSARRAMTAQPAIGCKLLMAEQGLRRKMEPEMRQPHQGACMPGIDDRLFQAGLIRPA